MKYDSSELQIENYSNGVVTENNSSGLQMENVIRWSRAVVSIIWRRKVDRMVDFRLRMKVVGDQL